MNFKTILHNTSTAIVGTLSMSMLLTPIATQASGPSLTPKFYEDSSLSKVNTTKGLNVRDENCKRIGTIPFGALVQVFDNSQTFTCTINQKTYSMDYTTMGYAVATEFLTPIYSTFSSLKVDSNSGLNIRDINCKRITTLAANTEISIVSQAQLNSLTCSVNGSTYAMNQVFDGTNTGYVATAFVTKGNSAGFVPDVRPTPTSKQPLRFDQTGFENYSYCGNPEAHSFYSQSSSIGVNMVDAKFLITEYEIDAKNSIDKLLTQTSSTFDESDVVNAMSIANSTCSGFISTNIQKLDGVTMPNVDQYAAFVSLDGQSFLLTPNVYVMGKKNNAYFVMSSSQYQDFEVLQKLYFSCLPANSIDSNGEVIDFATITETQWDNANSCYATKLTSPEKITQYKKFANDMIKQVNLR